MLLLRNKLLAISCKPLAKQFERRTGHFCQPLHVAVQLGLYLHPLSLNCFKRAELGV